MGKEIPTALSVMVYSLLKESTLVPAEGPKLNVIVIVQIICVIIFNNNNEKCVF